ncbi:MAG: hypothetical protein ACYTKD_14250 [Planctomycetota bacterium]|jgi:hypothetical protein
MGSISEPWGPIVLCGAVATVFWVVAWIVMKASGRFRDAALGGAPALVGGVVLSSLFGAVVLVLGALAAAVLSVFWVVAAATGTFEQEREAISRLMRSRGTDGNGSSDGR